jgi:DNA-binding transcriptional ArsR family regulator
MNRYEQTAEILKALGHPLRLQILEELRREGECCVCHLEAHLGQRQAYISQQLARLREARLVIDRRDGMNMYYALADDSLGLLLDEVLRTTEHIRSAQPQRQGARREESPDPVDCPCPKCQARRAAGVTSIPDGQGAPA